MSKMEEMLEWARKTYGDVPWVNNPELVRIAYERRFGAVESKIADLEPNMRVKIKALVVRKDREAEIMMKREGNSWSKCLNPRDPECEPRYIKNYTVGDDTGVVRVTIFSDDPDEELKLDTVYEFIGVGKKNERFNSMDFRVYSYKEVGNPIYENAKNRMNQIIEAQGGVIDYEAWNKLLDKFSYMEFEESLITDLGLQKVQRDGKVFLMKKEE